MKTFNVPTLSTKNFNSKPYVATSLDDMTATLNIGAKDYSATVEVEGSSDVLSFYVEADVVKLLDYDNMGHLDKWEVVGYVKKGKLHVEVSASYLPHVFDAVVLAINTYTQATSL